MTPRPPRAALTALLGLLALAVVLRWWQGAETAPGFFGLWTALLAAMAVAVWVPWSARAMARVWHGLVLLTLLLIVGRALLSLSVGDSGAMWQALAWLPVPLLLSLMANGTGLHWRALGFAGLGLGAGAALLWLSPLGLPPALAREVALELLPLALCLAALGMLLPRWQTAQPRPAVQERDPLTGLPSRAVLLAQDEAVLARGGQLLFVDIDSFRLVNDTMGHEAGDQVLREVAQHLRQRVGEGDLLVRISGDEFVLMLPGASPECAELVARNVLTQVQQPVLCRGQMLSVTASVGIAHFRAPMTVAEAVRHAEVAMQEVKARGRNSWRHYRPEQDTAAERRALLTRALQGAEERGELSLRFQPIVDLQSGEACRVEALLRWRHPRLGAVSPTDFIPLAEASGQIIPLGRWVLRKACRAAAHWHLQGCEQGVAVNVAPLQLAQPDFVDTVAQALRDSGLPPAALELEITESSASGHAWQHQETLQALHDLGVRLAVDDFGTGYSSLAYLRELPIHAVKIDRSFTRDLEGDAAAFARALIGAVVRVAQTLDLTTVAEGVETPGQQRRLLGLGCQQAQGYLYSRPVEFDELLGVLRRRPPGPGEWPAPPPRTPVVRRD